jgi:DNA-binding HxlR family transcriptional regulator
MAEKKMGEVSEEVVYKLGNRKFDCPIALTSNAISGKWKLLIMHRLSLQENRRYSELRTEISQVSEKMLIQQLRELEMDGLVKRKVYPVVPPKVEYYLTEKGKGIIPVIAAMRVWGSSFEH